MDANSLYREWVEYKAPMRVFISGGSSFAALELQRKYAMLFDNVSVPVLTGHDLHATKSKVTAHQLRVVAELIRVSIWEADLFVLLNNRHEPDPYSLLQLGMAIGKTPTLLVGKPLKESYMTLVNGLCHSSADLQRFLDSFSAKEQLKPTSLRVKVSLLEVRHG